VFHAPHHPYTEALVSASPSVASPGATRIRLEGEIPSATDLPSGCVFQTRCPRKIGPICEEQEPPLLDAGQGHAIRCHIPAGELTKLQTIDQTNAA
jgi:peptide/nickel transport system ATP-binding protein